MEKDEKERIMTAAEAIVDRYFDNQAGRNRTPIDPADREVILSWKEINRNLVDDRGFMMFHGGIDLLLMKLGKEIRAQERKAKILADAQKLINRTTDPVEAFQVFVYSHILSNDMREIDGGDYPLQAECLTVDSEPKDKVELLKKLCVQVMFSDENRGDQSKSAQVFRLNELFDKTGMSIEGALEEFKAADVTKKPSDFIRTLHEIRTDERPLMIYDVECSFHGNSWQSLTLTKIQQIVKGSANKKLETGMFFYITDKLQKEIEALREYAEQYQSYSIERSTWERKAELLAGFLEKFFSDHKKSGNSMA